MFGKDESRATFNGHPIIHQYPVNRLFRTSGGIAVRVSIDQEGSQNGRSMIYVHKKCCRQSGGGDINPVFDILLIDPKYRIYHEVINQKTGGIIIDETDKYISAEDVYDCAMKVKKHDARHPIPLEPDIITSEYCSEERFPYNATIGIGQMQ